MAEAKAADSSPRSTLWPWLRSVAYSLVMALSPAVWALETHSCEGGAGERPLTGLDLFADTDLSHFPDGVAFVLIFALAVGAPFLAWRTRSVFRRLAWHASGWVSSMVTSAFVGFLVFFTLFATRTVRPVGYVVLVLATLPVVEGLVRIALGVGEARAARREVAAAPLVR